MFVFTSRVALLLLRSTQLHASLAGYQPQVRVREQHLGMWASVLNTLGGNASEPEPTVEAPLGVYMHGGVGTGKTFMMDLFFQVGSECNATLMLIQLAPARKLYKSLISYLYQGTWYTIRRAANEYDVARRNGTKKTKHSLTALALFNPEKIILVWQYTAVPIHLV